jgi:DNA-3-methyladenine glycosylase I
VIKESGMNERCGWARGDQLLIDYHDEEWGVPLHDDRLLFEFLVLEGFQAGLSWLTILRKRENYRKAFERFDPTVVAQYDEEKIDELMQDTGIVRNRLKIRAAIDNARAFLDVQDEFGSYNAYIWQFVGGGPIQNEWRHLKEIPSKSTESKAMSQDLKRRRFKFVGPTICYAFMQAVGMVNDHTVDCYRQRQLRAGK